MEGIKNMEGLSLAEINRELSCGAKFVVFQYCISILVMTFRRSSDIYFIKSDDSATNHGLGYSLLTLCLGWWGISMGADIQHRFSLHQFHRRERCDSGSIECYELRPGVVFQRYPDIFIKRIESGLHHKSFYTLK
jgi:hypothetical protein